MSIKKTQKSMENLYYEVKTEIPCHEKKSQKPIEYHSVEFIH